MSEPLQCGDLFCSRDAEWYVQPDIGDPMPICDYCASQLPRRVIRKRESV